MIQMPLHLPPANQARSSPFQFTPTPEPSEGNITGQKSSEVLSNSQGSEQQTTSLNGNQSFLQRMSFSDALRSVEMQKPVYSQSTNQTHFSQFKLIPIQPSEGDSSSQMSTLTLSSSQGSERQTSSLSGNQSFTGNRGFNLSQPLNSSLLQMPSVSQPVNRCSQPQFQLVPIQPSEGNSSSRMSTQKPSSSQGSESQTSSLSGSQSLAGNQGYNLSQPLNLSVLQMPSGSQPLNICPQPPFQLIPIQPPEGNSSSRMSTQTLSSSQGLQQETFSLSGNQSSAGNQGFNLFQPLNSSLLQMPSGSLLSRRPLAPMQIREMRFRVDVPPSEILPDPKDPNFVVALNNEIRVNRLIADAMSNLKYKYDVRSIIRKEGQAASAIVESLDKGSFIYGYKRNVVVHAVVNHLFQSVRNKSLVSTVMRECMAIQIVATWPALKMYLYTREDRPWHHWYNAEQNMGYLENVTQVTQRAGKKRGSDGIRKSKNPSGIKKPRKLVAAPVQENHDDSDPEEYINYVAEARKLVGNPGEKTLVLQLMAQTFERRRVHINVREVETVRTLTEFPHFLHYSGEVIEQEFNLMFEQKQTCFVRVFEYEMVPKLIKIAETDPKKYASCTPSRFDVINAMVVLAKLLPTPIRTFIHEEKMPLQPDLNDLFQLIPAGSDPVSHVEHRCVLSQYKLQPYILAMGTTQAVRKMFLVVNGKIMELKNATPAHAIDILVKTFFAFNVHYPLAWKNVYRFIQVHVFQIPLENSRWSTFSETFLYLKNFKA